METLEDSINAADKIVHKVEKEWHYPIFTKYGYEPVEKEGVGFVRSYNYVHKERGNKIKWTTGVNADYWEGSGGWGYWADLEPYLKKLDEKTS
jgi:hypothetical protein